MQINHYPDTERLRVRDPILRDDDIRQAAMNVITQLCTIKQSQFNPKTGSVLIEYEGSSLCLDKLKSLIPQARKLQAKVAFYTPRKKAEILQDIARIESSVKAWNPQD